MSFFDTLAAGLTVIAPQLIPRIEKAAEIINFGYDNANPGRARRMVATSFSSGASENVRNQQDAVKIMWDTRDLRQNSPLINTVIEKESLYVCGSVRYQSLCGDQDIEREYEDYFNEWAEDCDITGRHSLEDMTTMAFQGMRVDGDHAWVTVAKDEGYKIQSIESDRIGDPNQVGRADPKYIRGITLDDYGKPTSYRVYERDMFAKYSNPKEVTPENFIHLFDPKRTDQYRGVSAWASCTGYVRDIMTMYRAELMAAGMAANIAGIITGGNSGDTGQPGNLVTNEKNSKGQPYFKPEPGMVYRSEGERFQMFESNRPSAAFTGFIEALTREIAGALGHPYEFIWNMAALGGASQRTVLMQEHRSATRLQNLIARKLLKPVVVTVIGNGIARRKIRPTKLWRAHKFHFPAHITADVGYQTSSDIALMNSGLRTATDIYGERGQDFEEQTEVLARESRTIYEIAKRKQVPMEWIAPQRLINATAQIAAMQDAKKPVPPPPPPQPGETGMVSTPGGEKAVQGTAEIMEKVSNGTLPRESAIWVLVDGYGYSPDQAERYTPFPDPVQVKAKLQPPAPAGGAKPKNPAKK